MTTPIYALTPKERLQKVANEVRTWPSYMRTTSSAQRKAEWNVTRRKDAS